MFRRLGAVGPVAVVLSFWPLVGGIVLLSLITQLAPWFRAQQVAGLVVFLLIFTGLLGFSFIPTFACSILAGWAFGFAVGWPMAMVAITAGSLIAFALGRWICRDIVLEIIRERPSWNAIHRVLLASGAGQTTFVVTLMRIPPSSPFALANFALAAMKVGWIEYTVGTLVGIAPRTAAAAFAAAQLEQVNFQSPKEGWVAAAGIAATVIVCLILGYMAKRALRDLTQARTPS